MSYGPIAMPPPARELSRKAAIIGVGETDFGADYRAERAKAPGYEAPEVEDLLQTAFERALADSGLSRADIDGVAVSYTYGGPPPEDVAKQFGLNPRYAVWNGNIMAGPLPRVCADVAEGKADVVALVFAVASRSAGRQFGGNTFPPGGGGAPSSYYYYHPWGWSSQAAHWSLMFSHYMHAYGVGEEDLYHVARQTREHAARNPNAIMQKPFTVEEYLASRYIVRPLHLLDICLVNDGAVCLIVSKTELAKGAAKPPVLVAGWAEAKIKKDKMQVMVRERLRPIIQDAGAQAMAMADVSLADIGHFEGYDPSTMHIINQVEGYGFVGDGEGIAFCKDGGMDLGGRIPTNTEGGNLSASYMQGWSQVVESVRQLRGEAGPRQVAGLDVAMSSLCQTDMAHPIIYVRGD
jgi:acetyl-CoA acetyltransferase